MKRLIHAFLVLIGRRVAMPRRALDLIEQAFILGRVLPRMEPLDNTPEQEQPIDPDNMKPIEKLTIAVAYLATLPALFAQTGKALNDALAASSVPGDTRRELEAAKAALAAKEAELEEFNALADQVGAAVDAADAADDGLPGADPELTGDGTGDALPPIPDNPEGPPVVDGTEIPPGGDPLAPGEEKPATDPVTDPVPEPSTDPVPPADPPVDPPVDPAPSSTEA